MNEREYSRAMEKNNNNGYIQRKKRANGTAKNIEGFQ